MKLTNEPENSSVNTQTAEQALKLAIRLQHEGGPQMSIDELDRTAEEAGIDRRYLHAALAQLQAEQSQIGLSAALSDRLLRRIVASAAVVFVAGAIARAYTTPISHDPLIIVYLVLAAFCTAVLAMGALTKSRNARRRSPRIKP